jgi:hypothetical protein
LPDHPDEPNTSGAAKRHELFKLERLELAFDRGQSAVLAWLGGWPALRSMSVAIVALALSPWLYAELRKELASALFRDAAQCQYSAWCLRHGVRLYRDVGAPDGPLIHFLHAFLQLFGGITDHGFRRADFVFQVSCSGAMGAALAPRIQTTRIGAFLSRAAWAYLGVVLWLSWYLLQGWAHTVQRDAYFALLGYLGLVLVYASADHTLKVARVTAMAGGVLCMLLVFSRHSGIVYPASAALALLFSDDATREMRALRVKATLQGFAIGLGLIVAGLLLFGSVTGIWFWYFRFPFTFHRWLAKQNAFYLFSEAYGEAAQTAVVALVGVVGAVAVRALPRRALAFAFVPMLCLIAACIEGKGWPNHVQQTTAVEVILELLVLSELWKYRAQSMRWRSAHAVGAALALLFVGYEANKTIHASGFLTWPVPVPVDEDIIEAKRVGDYLKQHTSPEDRVLYYGHEAHVLLNAERAPATPYYVNMSLNIELFYERAPAARGEEPNAEERGAIKRLQREISRDACRRIKVTPPGAMVFLDGSLGIFGADGRADVVGICPAVAPMLNADYHEVSIPGVPAHYHVYLRGH